jgi:two-component system, chemotaxis family, sensor kinase CheA
MTTNTEDDPSFKFSRGAGPLVDVLAEELAFIVPDQDTGILAVNSVASDLEDLASSVGLGPWSEGIELLRRWIDDLVQGDGVFNSGLIGRLELWHAWISDLIQALEDNQEPPKLPINWVFNDDQDDVGAPSKIEFDKALSDEIYDPDIIQGVQVILNIEEDIDLLTEFHLEALDLLEDIERCVLILEEKPDETSTIDTIFRAFHTFKGGAGMLRIQALADVAHELETLLDALRKKTLSVNEGIIDIILSGADFLARFTKTLGERLQGDRSDTTIFIDPGDLIFRAKRACAGEVPPPREPMMVAPVVAEPLNRLVASPVSETQAPKGDLTTNAAAVKAKPARVDESVNRLNFQIKSGVSSVKVDAEKLDNLVNLVGELIIAQLMVVEFPDVVSIKSLELSRNLRQLSRVTGELQKNAVSLRMVPIGGAFQKMGRLVRDLGISQAKSVQLVLEGEDVELDRNIVDKIGEPLIHLIRNAVDHGIEPPSKRLEDGKPEVGTVRLSAVHKRGGISIRIEDDGKGLDAGRIYKKAVDLGIISPGTTLTEAEIFSLIFVAGMSTAAAVTDVSGRGVGMDVVRETIENLRGKIEIKSKPGEGTAFTIMLPLTLAIIDGLLVGSGNDRYIIPTLSVRESFRPRQDMLSSVHGRSEMVRVRGQQVPLIRLDRCLGSETEPVPATEGIIIVLESGDASRALLVDQLLGKQEVVIKNIGKIFDQQPLVAGGAILVDGRVGLLLDVEKIIHMNF